MSKLIKNHKIRVCMVLGAITFAAIGIFYNAGYVTLGLIPFGAILGLAFGLVLFEMPKTF